MHEHILSITQRYDYNSLNKKTILSKTHSNTSNFHLSLHIALLSNYNSEIHNTKQKHMFNSYECTSTHQSHNLKYKHEHI